MSSREVYGSVSEKNRGKIMAWKKYRGGGGNLPPPLGIRGLNIVVHNQQDLIGSVIPTLAIPNTNCLNSNVTVGRSLSE
jgi:hypothetical protein